jgi:hypothetical protein
VALTSAMIRPEQNVDRWYLGVYSPNSEVLNSEFDQDCHCTLELLFDLHVEKSAVGNGVARVIAWFQPGEHPKTMFRPES